MCIPLGVAAGAAIVGAGLNLYGGHLEAEAQLQEGAYANKAARANARVSRVAASDAYTRGAQQAGARRMAASQQISQTRAAFGASGVDSSVGSPLHAMADVRMMSELDAQTTKNNAAREAWGLQVQALGQQQEGEFALKRAQHASDMTLLGSYGRFFGSMANLAGKG